MGSRRLMVMAMATVVVALVLPSTAAAATCADYRTQADAQRAADTIDADGDGIYCEVLPCPCLKPGRTDAGGDPSPQPRAPARTAPRKRAQYFGGRVSSVVDGDTIRVRLGRGGRGYRTVRLIGIDTPETKRPGTPVECGGKRATANMLELAFSAPADTDGDGLVDESGGRGRRVALSTDPTQDVKDRYGRLLAYVTTRSGDSLGARQLGDGWAETYVYAGRPFQQVARFRAAERRARLAGRGVWKRCGGRFHARISSDTAGLRGRG